MLEKRPDGAVDLLDSSLLVKRQAFLPATTDIPALPDVSVRHAPRG